MLSIALKLIVSITFVKLDQELLELCLAELAKSEHSAVQIDQAMVHFAVDLSFGYQVPHQCLDDLKGHKLNNVQKYILHFGTLNNSMYWYLTCTRRSRLDTKVVTKNINLIEALVIGNR